jgi:hypothetical protein
MSGNDDNSSIGQRLLEDLVKALAANTAIQGELITQLKAHREDLKITTEIIADLTGAALNGFRIVDQLSEIAQERNPKWTDVADVISEIRKEDEEAAEDGGETQELFPHRS